MSDTNELSIRQSAELSATKDAVREAQEVRAALQLAQEFPRNEDRAYQQLVKSCKRTSFAATAMYRYRRGQTNVEGPSVQLAREFARLWGNLQYGFTVVREDEHQRTLRGYAWDVETNTRIVQEAVFKKLIQRKDKSDGVTRWIEPDERDMRELANKHGAIATRNCMLQILPKDYVDEAMAMCKQTIKEEIEKDPDAAKKNIIKAFGELNIPISEVEELLGHGLASCSPAELAELRQIWKAVADGAATWASFFQTTEEAGEGLQGDRVMASKTNTRLAAALDRAKSTGEAKSETATAPAPTEAELAEQARVAQERLEEARRRNAAPAASMPSVGEALPKAIPQVTVADQRETSNVPPVSQEESSSNHSARVRGAKQQDQKEVRLKFD